LSAQAQRKIMLIQHYRAKTNQQRKQLEESADQRQRHTGGDNQSPASH
jgi:hypothetical protein